MNIKIPYKNLTFFSIIDEIEIPLLSHYIDEKSNNVLRYLINYTESEIQSIIWKAKEVNVYNYLNNKLSLRELILEDDKEFLYIHRGIQITNEDTVEMIPVSDISNDFLPEGNSYYGFGMPQIYEHLLDKYHSGLYVASLNERGVVLKIAPKTKKFGDTVSLSDIADFTTKISGSYGSFVEQEFYKNFKNEILDAKEYEKVKRRVLAKSEPRVCDAEFGSFEITISNDIINSENLEHNISEWSNEVLKIYADKVLYVDYSNENVIEEMIKNVSPIELKSIYEPFINTIAQNEYTVNVRSIGSDKSITFNQNYRKAKKEVRRVVVESRESFETVSKKKLVHMIVEIDANKEIGELNKSEIKKDLIFSYESKAFELFVDEIVRPEGKYVLLSPIEFKIEITDESKYFVTHSFLVSDLLIDDKSQIKEDILKSLNSYIDLNFDSDTLAFFNGNEIQYK